MTPLLTWKSTGKFQKTIATCIEKSGIGLHSGKLTTVKLWPELARRGRFFDICSNFVQASINFVEDSPLCTSLSKGGIKIRTVEHLLSALEATGVDNCRIEIASTENNRHVEVPILDGSAKEWVEAVEETGLKDAIDHIGSRSDKLVAVLIEPLHMYRNDSFVAAFPSSHARITYGIDFPQVPDIGCQWFSATLSDGSFYAKEIAPSRTFCIYEEVEAMHNAGLIKGGSIENALICSKKGWLNPPLHFHDEPCRHKVLDLIGDLSVLAHPGNQGLPLAHFVAYRAGHALHAEFARRLWKNNILKKST